MAIFDLIGTKIEKDDISFNSSATLSPFLQCDFVSPFMNLMFEGKKRVQYTRMEERQTIE